MPEWVLAVFMLGWGLITLNAQDLFYTQVSFQPLLNLMPQVAWAALAMFVGVVRLVFLIINGAWRPSAHIRAVGCFLGTLFWSAQLIASLQFSSTTPNAAIFAALLGLDVLSLWFSAGDAKLADLLAKGKLEAV